jgi:hypothetical protein
LHNIITDMIHNGNDSHTTPDLLPPIVSTPIRRTPKIPYKSPFKPINDKEYDQRIYLDRKGASTNGRVLRPIPRFSPSPAKIITSYEQCDYPDHSAMVTTPTPPNVNYHLDPMEWEHPLHQAATTMTTTGFAPPSPRYDIHFSLSGPSKIGPPVPSEVVVVPTTYMTTTNCNSKSESKSIKSAPPKATATVHRLPSPKVAPSYSAASPEATKPIHQIYAAHVNTTAVIPSKERPVNHVPGAVGSNPTTPVATTAKVKMNRTKYRAMTTPYVPPAPIDSDANFFGWDDCHGIEYMNRRSSNNVTLPPLQRNVSPAFAPGQQGYYHAIDAPKDVYSSPHHHRMTTTTSDTTMGGQHVAETGRMSTTDFRAGNNNNCMSSCSSSSLSNSTMFGGHRQRSTTRYEQYEA